MKLNRCKAAERRRFPEAEVSITEGEPDAEIRRGLMLHLLFCIFPYMAIPAPHRKTKQHDKTSARGSLFESMPGADLILRGLLDLERGAYTIPALLVLIGRPRLRNLGLQVPPGEPEPEYALYEQLSQHDPDSAHARYNALIRTLVSFERAAECAAG